MYAYMKRLNSAINLHSSKEFFFCYLNQSNRILLWFAVGENAVMAKYITKRIAVAPGEFCCWAGVIVAVRPRQSHQLHWLKAKERIDFKLALLIYKCQHGTAPSYLADELS